MSRKTPPGIIIAAPRSGSGKTTTTLALIRLLTQRGLTVHPAKIGPDFIDPAFLAAAAQSAPCLNLDPWAMRPATLQHLIRRLEKNADIIIAEGVMGLFDAARDGHGSTADLARKTGWPVILVADARGTGRSIGAALTGFTQFQPDITIAGIILNRVGSALHRRMLREGCEHAALPLLAMIPSHKDLTLPSRHLGLVQAGEHAALDAFLNRAAAIVADAVDPDAFCALARPATTNNARPPASAPFPPPGQTIAIARDDAFTFTYPAWLQAWRDSGADLSFFSPLADAPPPADADAVFLPGGYPELHAAQIANADNFMRGLRDCAARNAVIYGECGGYMVLGKSITADEKTHPMAGLLPLQSVFHPDDRTLGYRTAELTEDGPLGRRGALFRGHEFHAARSDDPSPDPLFHLRDPADDRPRPAGARVGSVMGSFLHLIDAAGEAVAP